MKVLLYANGPIAKIGSINPCVGNSDISWISAMIEDLLMSYDIEVVYVFPQDKVSETITGDEDNFSFHGLFRKKHEAWEKDEKFKKEVLRLIEEVHPDVIHMWGTEFAHYLDFYEAAEQAGMADRTIIHIQGLVGFLGEKFYASLPHRVCVGWTFRDLVRHSNIAWLRKQHLKRGRTESELLRRAKNVAGRTEFDFAHVKQITPNINYFSCNESMRQPFFERKWNYEKCEKNTIFITQGHYPIKGLHIFVKAIGCLKKNGYDIKVYVAGNQLIYSGLSCIRETSYAKYIRKLMKENDVVDNFVFIGYLPAEQVAERLEKANLFVIPSAMENSPNSLAEALVVGTPVIAAYSGGIPSMVQDGVNGLTYQYDDEVVLASCILKLLRDKDLCIKLSEEERRRARVDYAAANNNKKLYSIYERMTITC